MIDRRKRREMAQGWHDLREAVSAAPLWPRPASWGGALGRLGLAIALYAALIVLHPPVFGVSPLG